MSNKRKQLNELTLKDNFMFAAVMLDPSNCKPLLEMILGIDIGKIEISHEKSIVYNPEYHGIRLDVYAKDEAGSHYNIEMQVRSTEVVKRSRYYHSQMDMELLTAGADYARLPDACVIFICDYDPIGYKKYYYTQESIIRELPEYRVMDGRKCVYLSTCGENPEEVSEDMVAFLDYVRANLDESMKESKNSFVKQLQEAVERIKKSREMGNRYMIFQEMLREEYEDGKAEGLKIGRAEGLKLGRSEGLSKGLSRGQVSERIESILELLRERGTVDLELEESIRNYTELEKLKKLFSLAVKVENVELFKSKMKDI